MTGFFARHQPFAVFLLLMLAAGLVLRAMLPWPRAVIGGFDIGAVAGLSVNLLADVLR